MLSCILEDEIIGWCPSNNDTDANLLLTFKEPKVIFNLTLQIPSLACFKDTTSVLERFTLKYLDPMDPDATLRTYDKVTLRFFHKLNFEPVSSIRYKLVCDQLVRDIYHHVNDVTYLMTCSKYWVRFYWETYHHQYYVKFSKALTEIFKGLQKVNADNFLSKVLNHFAKETRVKRGCP